MIDIEHPEQLLAYLRQNDHIHEDEVPKIQQLKGGVSNRTVHVQRDNGEAWVIKQALEKLRVEADWFSSPERIHREGAGLRILATLTPPNSIAELVFEDFDRHILAMKAIPQPHDNWKSCLLEGKIDYVEQFGTLLGTIHHAAYEDRDTIKPIFEDRHFFETLRLEPYYHYAAEQVPQAKSFINALIHSLEIQTLVHGDYSPKNILVYDGRLILLDHEVIHWGDPAFDIGFSMTHFLSKAHHLSAYRVQFANAAHQYWQSYYEILGAIGWQNGLEQRAVNHTLGCLLARVAGRSQLEYMDIDTKQHQRDIVLTIMKTPPITIPALIDEFIERL